MWKKRNFGKILLLPRSAHFLYTEVSVRDSVPNRSAEEPIRVVDD